MKEKHYAVTRDGKMYRIAAVTDWAYIAWGYRTSMYIQRSLIAYTITVKTWKK